METQVNQAQIAAPVVINNAQGKVNATVATNKAQMQAFYDVTKTEAVQYERMYKALQFGNFKIWKRGVAFGLHQGEGHQITSTASTQKFDHGNVTLNQWCKPRLSSLPTKRSESHLIVTFFV